MEPFRKYPLAVDDPRRLIRDNSFAATAFDDDGIVLIRYKYNDIGLQYSPVKVAQYALSNYNMYLGTHHERYLSAFAKHAQWLVDAFVDKSQWGVWHFQFDFISQGSRCLKPWPSSMAQGLGISTLIRYHSLTEDVRALETARKALAAYDVTIADGGILRVDQRGLKWYEEFACPGSGTALNGFIFSLIGAKEWYDYTGDLDGLERFDSGIETLEQGMNDFELKLPLMRWTRHDNRFVIHSGGYHDLHVTQLRVLWELRRGDTTDFLYEYYRKWRSWRRTYGESCLFMLYQNYARGMRLSWRIWFDEIGDAQPRVTPRRYSLSPGSPGSNVLTARALSGFVEGR